MKKCLKKILEKIFDSKFTLYDNMQEYESVKQERLSNENKFKKGVEISVKIINLVLVFIVGYTLFGCTAKTETVYKPVYVPVHCEIEIPQKPKTTNDVVLDNINLVKYTETIENALHYCIK